MPKSQVIFARTLSPLRFQSDPTGRNSIAFRHWWVGFLLMVNFLAVFSLGIRGQSSSNIIFVDMAEKAGLRLKNICGPAEPKRYIFETDGNGVGFVDYDKDGDLDIVLVQGSTREKYSDGGDPLCALYRNDGAGTFTDVTARSGMNRRGWGFGLCAGDYDNDGWEDLYITAMGKNVLYRNRGDGTFEDVSAKAGVDDPGYSTGAAFADYDNDGFLDLYVANYVTIDINNMPEPGDNPYCFYRGIPINCGPRGLPGAADSLYHNRGNGTFENVAAKLNIDQKEKYYGFAVVWGDYDDDGDSDIYVANDSHPNYLWRNNGDGTFSEEGLTSGAGLSEDGHEQAGMGAAFGDFDNNGRLDIIVTNFSDDTYTLYRNDDRGFFTDTSTRAGLGRSTWNYLGWGTQFFDYDNDGWVDLFFANGHVYPEVDQYRFGTRYAQRNQLFRNLANGKFSEVKAASGLSIAKSSRGAAFGDYDNDGDVDILISNLNDFPTLLENRGGAVAGHWLSLKLEGTQSNRSAIGARVTVRIGESRKIREVRSGGSYQSQSDLRVHFGLGKSTRIDEMLIRWPSGRQQRAKNLRADQFYFAQEGKAITPDKLP